MTTVTPACPKAADDHASLHAAIARSGVTVTHTDLHAGCVYFRQLDVLVLTTWPLSGDDIATAYRFLEARDRMLAGQA